MTSRNSHTDDRAEPAAEGGFLDGRSQEHEHAVRFYETEEFLADVVAQYLEEGLEAGEPLLVIATESHRTAICDRLRVRGRNPDAEVAVGRLTLVDARATLERFMSGGMPHAEWVTQVVGGILDRSAAQGGGRRTRVFGEMVDLLWKDGNAAAALRLEEQWNGLLASRPLSLLCAYGMNAFDRHSHAEGFRDLCGLHTHVVPAESYSGLGESDSRMREISSLQQRSRALDDELGRRARLEGALRDATESAKAVEERFRAIFEQAAVGMAHLRIDGSFVSVNAKLCQILGWDALALLAANLDAILHATDRADDAARRRALTLGGTGSYTWETRCVRGDGSTVWTNLTVSLVQVVSGEPYLIAVLEDISTRKRAEQARQVAQALAEKARAEAEAASRSKDEFLAMLGHELRNPLAPIMTALELQRLRGDATGGPERTIIERQVRHMARLVDDLLDVSRITLGKITLQRERVEVAAIVAKAIEMAAPLLEERRHDLRVDVPSRGLVVDGDATRLAQVVCNLLTNAAKYTDAGGRVTVSAASEGGAVVIRVRDNGLGIASEMLPRIFELFVQEGQALDRSQGGLGLGLAIVRSIVALHGGTVDAASEGRGSGSEFTVKLPAPHGESAPQRLGWPSAPGACRQASRRVLVVDDNQDAAEMLAAVLRALGHTPRVAHDGPTALGLAEAFDPEVVLLDIGLPVMDGYEVARRLRDIPRLRHVKLVAVTGYGQEADRRRSADAGFDVHLVKPVDVRAVETLIIR